MGNTFGYWETASIPDVDAYLRTPGVFNDMRRNPHPMVPNPRFQVQAVVDRIVGNRVAINNRLEIAEEVKDVMRDPPYNINAFQIINPNYIRATETYIGVTFDANMAVNVGVQEHRGWGRVVAIAFWNFIWNVLVGLWWISCILGAAVGLYFREKITEYLGELIQEYPLIGVPIYLLFMGGMFWFSERYLRR